MQPTSRGPALMSGGGGTIGLVNHNHKNKDNENSYNDSNNNNDTHNEITATIMLAVVEQDEQIST